jgi:hypothetical protein
MEASRVLKRCLACSLVLALAIPAGLAPGVGADHERADAQQVCPLTPFEDLIPDEVPEIEDCRDNDLTAPGAHAVVTNLSVESEGCTTGPALCEVTVTAEAEHWAWRPQPDTDLELRVVGPTGVAEAEDQCQTPWEFRSTCYTQASTDYLAPTEPIDAEVEPDAWPAPDAVASPQTFCAIAIAETEPVGATGEANDEQDEDTARDMRGTCFEIDQNTFNGLP